MDDRGIFIAAAWTTAFVKGSSIESTAGNPALSSCTDWVKSIQSAFFKIQFGCRDSERWEDAM
jgi:hypothetical protein